METTPQASDEQLTSDTSSFRNSHRHFADDNRETRFRILRFLRKHID